MKRSASHAPNQRTKFLARLAGVKALIARKREEEEEINPLVNEFAMGLPPGTPAPISHSTPICSTPFSTITVDSEGIEFSEFSSSNHLFDIDVQSEDQDGSDTEEMISDVITDLEEERSTPLYSNRAICSRSISLDNFCCILVAYQRKNRLSDVAMNGFCRLIKRLLPAPNNCPDSFGIVQRKVRRFIDHEFNTICSNLFWFCTYCRRIFGNRTDCLSCCDVIGRIKKPAVFFQCNIENQLKLIIDVHGEEIIKFLSNTTTFCNGSTAVKDMSSGYYYREYALPNPRGNDLCIHLLINADGAKFTKAKSGSFWPIDAQIIELPPKLRVKFENAILFALWQGDSKPEWNVVMEKFINELRTLSKVGFPARINGQMYFVRVKILATVFDLPAAASIWNTIQFNGKFGCMHCKEPGIVFNKRRIWPYSEDIEPKDTIFWQDAYGAIQSGLAVPYCGVKGRSVLAELDINPYLQNPLDFMHQSYEGVFDKILCCLFGSGNPWSFGKGKNLREMDALVSTIKFPVDFQRRIPSLEELNNFKASEFKNFLLYGIVPVFSNFLSTHSISDPKVVDFLHWIMLYHEVAFRLNSDQVELESLKQIERLISVWQQLFPDFIGEENQTYNAHSTRHLVHFARLLGPLHNYSTFAFESFNNVYAKMVTSAHGTLSQVARRFMEEKYIKFWCGSKIKDDQTAALMDDIFGKGDTTSSEKWYGSVKLLSSPENADLSKNEVHALELAFGSPVSSVQFVNCVKVHSMIIRSQVFEADKSMCTHVGKFSEQEGSFYGTVYRMFLYANRVYGLCKELKVTGVLTDSITSCCDSRLSSLWKADSQLPPYGSFFKLVASSDAFRVVEMKNLAKRCILAEFDSIVILMEECMSFEHN